MLLTARESQDQRFISVKKGKPTPGMVPTINENYTQEIC